MATPHTTPVGGPPHGYRRRATPSSSRWQSLITFMLGDVDEWISAPNPDDAADPSDDEGDAHTERGHRDKGRGRQLEANGGSAQVIIASPALSSLHAAGGIHESVEYGGRDVEDGPQQKEDAGADDSGVADAVMYRYRPYRDGFTSLRSIWRSVKRFRLTNAYIPSRGIVEGDAGTGGGGDQLSSDSGSIDIDYSRSIFLGFKNSAMQQEYRRFFCRDVSTIIVGMPWLFGTFMFPATSVNPAKETYPYSVAAGVVMAVALCVDLILHMFYPRRARTPLYRLVMAWGMNLGPYLGSTITISAMYMPCTTADFGIRDWSYRTPERVAKYCWDMIDGYVPALFLLCSTFIRVPVLQGFAINALGYALWESSRYIYGLDALQRDSTITVHFIIGALCMAFSMVSLVAREHLAQSQLVQAVKTARLRYQSERRAKEADTLLCAMVPPSVLSRVMEGIAVRDFTPNATVFFSDMAGFTQWSSQRSAREVLDLLNTLCIELDVMAVAMAVTKIKTIGDAYWAVTGLPDTDAEHAHRMVRFALLFQEIAARLVTSPQGIANQWGDVRFRIGIHSGPLQGAVLGTQSLSYEVMGPTSRIAEEVEKAGRPLSVVVSHSTALLLCADNIRGGGDLAHTQPSPRGGGGGGGALSPDASLASFSPLQSTTSALHFPLAAANTSNTYYPLAAAVAPMCTIRSYDRADADTTTAEDGGDGRHVTTGMSNRNSKRSTQCTLTVYGTLAVDDADAGGTHQHHHHQHHSAPMPLYLVDPIKAKAPLRHHTTRGGGAMDASIAANVVTHEDAWSVASTPLHRQHQSLIHQPPSSTSPSGGGAAEAVSDAIMARNKRRAFIVAQRRRANNSNSNVTNGNALGKQQQPQQHKSNINNTTPQATKPALQQQLVGSPYSPVSKRHAAEAKSSSGEVIVLDDGDEKQHDALADRVGGGFASLGVVEDDSTAASTTEENGEQLGLRLERRRYKWVLQNFADPLLESEFMAFESDHSHPWRLSLYCAFVLWHIGIFIWPTIEAAEYTTAFIALQSIAVAATVVLVLCSRMNSYVQALLIGTIHITSTYGTWSIPYSVLGNDVSWQTCTSLLLLILLRPMNPLIKLSLAFVLIDVPSVVGFHKSIYIVGNFVFVVCISFIATIQSLLLENLARTQFIQSRVAERYAKDALAREEEQQWLLSCVVPRHIVPELLQWLRSDMRPQSSIVHEYSRICVAFIQLIPPPSEPTAAVPTAAALPFPAKESVAADEGGEHPNALPQFGDDERTAAVAAGRMESPSTFYAGSEDEGQPAQSSAYVVDVPRFPISNTAHAPPHTTTNIIDTSIDAAREAHAASFEWLVGAQSALERALTLTNAVLAARAKYMSDIANATGAAAKVGDAVADNKGDGDGPSPASLSPLLSTPAAAEGAIKTTANNNNPSSTADCPQIIKVKTIGDITLLAGSFTGGGGSGDRPAGAEDDQGGGGDGMPRDMAEALLAIVAKVSAEGHCVRVGLNVGPVVASVLGTERLCFDIFGDTVNLASRAMTAGVGVAPNNGGGVAPNNGGGVAPNNGGGIGPPMAASSRASINATTAFADLLLQSSSSPLPPSSPLPQHANASALQHTIRLGSAAAADDDDGEASSAIVLTVGPEVPCDLKGKGLIPLRRMQIFSEEGAQ